jgi:hypothetical protein
LLKGRGMRNGKWEMGNEEWGIFGAGIFIIYL